MPAQDSPTTHRQVADYYDRIYYRQDSVHPLQVSRHLRVLAGRLGVQAGQQVLDIACGRGEWLAAVAERGAQVSGIDISKQAIKTCRRRFAEGRFEVGPAERLPFADQQFDLVSCLGSLEHFLDQPRALQEMVRVVRPAGRILLLVPNAGFLTYRLGLFGGTQQQAIRETIRPLAEWHGMFSTAGLEVSERWRDLHVLDAHWILRAPWYRVPLRLAQGAALALWPLEWQYQVYHLCRVKYES